MRNINRLVIHCSATKEGVPITAEQIRDWHLARGFYDIGYHFVITNDGKVHPGRPIEKIGAHAKGYNYDSIGICYTGGLDKDSNPKDTRTPDQKKAMTNLITALKSVYKIHSIVGHRDLSVDLNGDGVISKNEWMKACPSFDAIKEYD